MACKITWLNSRDGNGIEHEGFLVDRVYIIINPAEYFRYTIDAKEPVITRKEPRPLLERMLDHTDCEDDEIIRTFDFNPNDREISRERFLLHGTTPDIVPRIIEKGLNSKYSSGLFGGGLYFTEHGKCIELIGSFQGRRI